MPGRKRIEVVVSFECNEGEDINDCLGAVEEAVNDTIPSAWQAWADIILEEEL